MHIISSFSIILFKLFLLQICLLLPNIALAKEEAVKEQEKELKTHYGIGYEKRMEIIKKRTASISRPQNNMPMRVQKIHRPTRPQRPMRPGH